jgi:phytol kinase
MWLDPFFQNKIAQDGVATLITLVLALGWLRLIDALAVRGFIEQRLSRKIIHIGTGPLFVVCWNLFSAQPWARWCASLVPLAITVQFFLVGIGVIKDEAAVKAMTRHDDRREILKGPLYYGLIFVICTLLFWRASPVGILALMLMCGGDGLADVIGRRWGTAKLPFSLSKSWVGSGAMFAGSFGFGLGFVWLFNSLGNFQPPLALGATTLKIAVIALAATLVEALPFQDIDNLTTTAVALALGLWLF